MNILESTYPVELAYMLCLRELLAESAHFDDARLIPQPNGSGLLIPLGYHIYGLISTNARYYTQSWRRGECPNMFFKNFLTIRQSRNHLVEYVSPTWDGI